MLLSCRFARRLDLCNPHLTTTKIAIKTRSHELVIAIEHYAHKQGTDFDDMSSFFLYEIDDAIQYINLGYGAQAPKMVIL